MRVVLIGGNPKGYDTPFHPNTVSGKRLRKIISEVGLSCEIDDMTNNRNDVPSESEKRELVRRYKKYQVIFLGRFVEKELRSCFPEGVYLPHPASRRRVDLENLVSGIKKLKLKED